MKAGLRLMTPWALASAAKVSLASGTEHRSPGVTDRDVLEICAAFAAVRDPLGGPEEVGRVHSFMTRTANEQFSYQLPPAMEIARTRALYLDSFEAGATEVYTPSILETLLGCSLDHFIGAGFLLGAGAQENGGWFRLSFLDHAERAEIEEHVPLDVLQHVLREHFETTVDALRREATDPRHALPSCLGRHEFNPLVNRPLVRWSNDSWLAPQPSLVFRRLWPDSIYYLGAAIHGQPWQRDIGVLFQNYVGRKLSLISDANVIPEVVYDGGNRSVDWIVVWDDLVLLVEAKSTRLTQGARAGLPALEGKLEDAVGKAFKQIETARELIQARHPAFSDIPADRPLAAIVATLDSYWMANSSLLRDRIKTPAPSVPTVVAAARELELLTALGTTEHVSTLLLDTMADPELRTWNLELVLRQRAVKIPANPILDASWEAYPWSEASPAIESTQDEPT